MRKLNRETSKLINSITGFTIKALKGPYTELQHNEDIQKKFSRTVWIGNELLGQDKNGGWWFIDKIK